MKKIKASNEAPIQTKDETIVYTHKTQHSEVALLDVGAFEDDARMYELAERFEENGWEWSRTFPEMDARQLADYLEGRTEVEEDERLYEDPEYHTGIKFLASWLKEIKMKEKQESVVGKH